MILVKSDTIATLNNKLLIPHQLELMIKDKDGIARSSLHTINHGK